MPRTKLKLVVTKPLRHERKALQRKEQRKAKIKEWSKSRPKPPSQVDVFTQMMAEAEKKFGKYTRFTQADTIGLSPSTIKKHLELMTANPYGKSLQMWARALGGRLVFVKDATD